MPYRDVILSTGERFRVRVSDEAVSEWHNDREWLRGQHRPDRPPDGDTGPLRWWLPHRDEEDHPWFASMRREIESDAVVELNEQHTPIASYVWNRLGTLSKLIVHGTMDGGFEVTSKMESTVDGSHRAQTFTFGPDEDPVRVGELIEGLLVKLDELFASPPIEGAILEQDPDHVAVLHLDEKGEEEIVVFMTPPPTMVLLDEFVREDEARIAEDEVGVEFGFPTWYRRRHGG